MLRATSLVRLLHLSLPVLLAMTFGAALAWAFAEEPLGFRDPYTGTTTDHQISTIHFDLSYPLALAAGFSVTDSRHLMIWNQLVDSEVITVTGGVSYTNCGGSFPPEPDAADHCQIGDRLPRAWPPVGSEVAGNPCLTSRFGPFMPLFHFPHPADLAAMRDWAWGEATQLAGYQAYAWGAFSTIQAPCKYTSTTVVATTMQAGSLEAFATYLHSLADYYSHRDCIAVMDAMGMPWAVHTLTDTYACDYNPSQPTADDAHGREFGAAYTDSLRTDEGVRAVYIELVARSLHREGEYFPLGLDAELTSLAGSPTLSQALYNFVHTWVFSQPLQRRQYADAMVAAILAQRQPRLRVNLPAILRE